MPIADQTLDWLQDEDTQSSDDAKSKVPPKGKCSHVVRKLFQNNDDDDFTEASMRTFKRPNAEKPIAGNAEKPIPGKDGAGPTGFPRLLPCSFNDSGFIVTYKQKGTHDDRLLKEWPHTDKMSVSGMVSILDRYHIFKKRNEKSE